MLTDNLIATAQGDQEAFRRVYDESAPKLTAVLMRMLKDRAEMEEVLQEVYLRVWNRAASYQPDRGPAMAWLIAIARNAALDRLRAGARGAAAVSQADDDVLDALPDPTPGAEAMLHAGDEARRLIACLDRLAPQRAAAVRGAYLEGLAYAELAERFDLPLNTLRTWLRRALLALRECMSHD